MQETTEKLSVDILTRKVVSEEIFQEYLKMFKCTEGDIEVSMIVLRIKEDFDIQLFLLKQHKYDTVTIFTSGLCDADVNIDTKAVENGETYEKFEMLLIVDKGLLGIKKSLSEIRLGDVKSADTIWESWLIHQIFNWVSSIISDKVQLKYSSILPFVYSSDDEAADLVKKTIYRSGVCFPINKREITITTKVLHKSNESNEVEAQDIVVGVFPVILLTESETLNCTNQAKTVLQTSLVTKAYGNYTPVWRESVGCMSRDDIVDALSELLI